MKSAQRLEGQYAFSEERWALFESILKSLTGKGIKVLAFIPPYHPITATVPVKDKDGVTAPDYEDQVKRMREAETRYPHMFFFVDINKMGTHGLLEANDFGDIDHPNGSGARS